MGKDNSERLAHYRFQMGSIRGTLATALDVLTDTLALVGQHSIYCRSVRDQNKPAMDVRMMMDQIQESKNLIIDAMEELKQNPEQKREP